MKNTGPVVSIVPRSASVRRAVTGFAAALIFAAMAGFPSVQAANVYWDGDVTGTGNSATVGTGLGGAGSWNNSLSSTPLVNWWPGSGTTDQTWVNANNDTAIFWGTAGTVTLTDNTTAGGLLFNTTGYTLDGATNTKTLTLATGSAILLGSNIAAATITGAVTGSGAVTITRDTTGATSGSAVGALNLNGTSTGGWFGATTISNGATVALSGSNQALLNTSSIALGGSITLTNASLAEAGLNRVSDTAAITSTGGTFTVTNTVASATPYSETIGAVGLTSGALNIVSTNANTGGAQVLTLANLTQAGSSTIAFSAGGGLNTGTNQVVVSGKAQTTAGQIIGPWATVGTSAASQTDYAIYDATSHVVAANIGSSAETTWTTAANAYTLSGGTTLTGARTITALRATGAAQTLALGGFNLEANGILNGGSGTLTISGTGNLRQQGTAAGNLYIDAGSAGGAISISSIIADNTGKLTLVKTGAGTLNLSGVNTYTGTTIVQEGTLTPTSSVVFNGDIFVGSLGGGPAAVFASNAINVNLKSDNSVSATVYSNGTFGWANAQSGHLKNLTIIGGTVNSGFGYIDGTITMTGGNITGNLAGSSTTVNTNASTSTAVINNLGTAGAITFTVADGLAAIDLQVNTGPSYQFGSLIKKGAGVMALGSSSYTSTTTVNAGTLLLTGSGALTNSALANGGTGIVFDSSVSSHAFTVGGLNGSGNLALQDNAASPNTVALTLNVVAGGTRTYSGVLSGAGGVTKTLNTLFSASGVSTQVLSGANTYTGATTVSKGTLKAGVASVANVSGAFGKNSAVTMANDATAILDLNGFNTQIGSLAGGGATGGNVSLGSATLSTGGDNTSTSYAGVISGTGGLTKIGTGAQALTAANLYTGATTVSAGVLNLGVDSAVSSSSNMGLSGGTLQSAFSQTLGTLNLTASSTLDLSTGGTFVFADSSALSWTGTLSIVGTFTDDFSVKFGAGLPGLTSGQLGQITINGLVASIDSNGFLTATAIPEPATYAAIFGAMVLAGVVYRRRRSARR